MTTSLSRFPERSALDGHSLTREYQIAFLDKPVEAFSRANDDSVASCSCSHEGNFFVACYVDQYQQIMQTVRGHVSS